MGRSGRRRSGGLVGRPVVGVPLLAFAPVLALVLLCAPVAAAPPAAALPRPTPSARATQRAQPAEPAHPGRSAPSAPSARSAQASAAAAAQAQAEAAAGQVDRLTSAFESASAQARSAAADLAQAFVDGEQVEQDRVQAQRDLVRADAARAATVRAVYAEGGPGALVLGVLSAPTAEDLLWQLSTVRVVTADLLDRSDHTAVAAAGRAARALRAARIVTDSDARLAVALGQAQDRSADAERALGQAQATLARLSAAARAAKVAELAAARLAAAQRAADAARLASTQNVGALGIPAGYEATYRAAAQTCPGLRWSLLAAVGQVESGHGRNNGPSSAGAIGPMQFMPATFASYAVDGDHDGVLDAWDYHDAIFTAARYLCVSGAEGGSDAGIRAAIFTYNHAQWYVDLVLGAERAILARAAAGP